MILQAQIPIVAIVGRPNVGKSTLFNRFAGHRRALALDEPGITRDRIAEEIEVGGRRVLLVDTAGLDPDAEAGLGAAVQAQAQSAIEGADAILFLVDGKSGLLPQDEELARTLRRSSKPMLLVVNKIDQPEHAPRLAEFHRLGFTLMRGVSAEHGSGDLRHHSPSSADPLLPQRRFPSKPADLRRDGRSRFSRIAPGRRAVVARTPGHRH